MKLIAKTKGMPREEWLELRKHSLGGSDASVVLDLSSFRSQYTLWADKRGLIGDNPDNEAMRIGRDLEQYVADRFCEATGKKVHRRNAMFAHDNYDFISANVDREVVGENAGLECKTTSVFAKADFENGEIPLYYYCQCMHYMSVMGYDKMYLAVLVLGKAFYWFEIPRNETEIAALLATEVNWWNKYILGDEVPEIDGSDSTTNTLKEVYSDVKDESVALYGFEELAKNYKQATAKAKEYKDLAETYKNQIAGLIGEHETADLNGYTVTYKRRSRTDVDDKKLKAEMPEIYKKYSKTTTFRTLKVKELKEA